MVNIDKKIQMLGILQNVVAEQPASIDIERPEQSRFFMLNVGDVLQLQRPLHVVGVDGLLWLAGLVGDDAGEQRGVSRHGSFHGLHKPVAVE